MDCLCGKQMTLLIKENPAYKVMPGIKVWVCPPEGCGRIYLGGFNSEVGGTWYLAEQNDRRDLL